MAVLGDLFFYAGFGKRATLADALRNSLDAGVRAEIDKLKESDFAAHDDAALVAKIVEKCRAEPIVLKRGESVGDAKPIKISVNDHFGGQVSVDGLRVTKTIPFDGDAVLFELQPDQYDLNPPRGIVRGQNVVLGMEVRQSQSEEAIRYIEETLGKIETYIGRQIAAIDDHNAALPGVALAHIQRRRAMLGNASDIANRLSGR